MAGGGSLPPFTYMAAWHEQEGHMAAKRNTKHTIEFEGETYEYDTSMFYKWSFEHELLKLKGAPQVFMAADALFEDSDKVAERLGDDIERMTALVYAIMGEMGGEEKN